MQLSSPIILRYILFFSLIYFFSQIYGLRYTNHDDIYFHGQSIINLNDYHSFTKEVAHKQARIQAYINMPLILFIQSLSNSMLYDICNIFSYLLFIFGFIHLLSFLGSNSLALGIAISSCLLFPLHYYFTFPQGYPVMGIWTLVCAIWSCGFLAKYLKTKKTKLLVFSLFLFFFSLFGSEYNFLLHPLLLFITFMACRNVCNVIWKDEFKTLLYFSSLLVVNLVIYFYYRLTSIALYGENVHGRVAPIFDLYAILETSWILLIKAFLPTGLYKGIVINPAIGRMTEQVPHIIDYSNVFQIAHTSTLVACFFCLNFILFIFLIPQVKCHNFRNYIWLLLLFFAFGTIPALILSTSSSYQVTVIQGFLQGHLASFYIQFSLCSTLFILSIFIYQFIKRKKLKKIICFFLALLFSCWSSTTFAYNIISHKIMSANQQKWTAFDLFIDYVIKNPEIKGREIDASHFWEPNGVSVIPAQSPLDKFNYWELYASKSFVYFPKISNSNYINDKQKIFLSYVATSNNNPLVLMLDTKQQEEPQLLVISQKALAARINIQNETGTTIETVPLEWICEYTCVSRILLENISVFKSIKIEENSF